MRLLAALAAVVLALAAAPVRGAQATGVSAPAVVSVLPPAPSPSIARWIGEYRAVSPTGGAEETLTLFEEGGRLRGLGQGLDGADLTPDGPSRLLSTAGGPAVQALASGERGEVAAVRVGALRLDRRDVGAEAQAGIRAGVKAADWRALRAAALAASPPQEPPPTRASDLVRLVGVVPDVKLDIRYATANNFMGVPIYERADAWMQRPAALALARVAAALRPQGLGLLIYDAYRPWYATRMFWDATPPANHVFVADPAQGSRHNRGCAVDLALYDLSTGAPVPMPSRYDEMSPRAYPDYRGGTSRERAFRDLLRAAMEREGFTVYPQEWWHFDSADWRAYGIGAATLTELVRAAPR